MRYTAKEVREHAEFLHECMLNGINDPAPELRWRHQDKIAAILTAYADDLERSDAGVTDEVVKLLVRKFDFAPPQLGYWHRWKIALDSVWPIAAESAQPADSGRVTELLAYLDNQAQHPRDQFGNGSNKPNPTLKAWYAKQAAIVRALAAQVQPTTPILNIRCESVSPDGVKGSTYLPVVRVEVEDDGSFTAVTNYWPTEQPQGQPAERDEIAEEAWRAFYEAAGKVQKESQSNG